MLHLRNSEYSRQLHLMNIRRKEIKEKNERNTNQKLTMLYPKFRVRLLRISWKKNEKQIFLCFRRQSERMKTRNVISENFYLSLNLFVVVRKCLKLKSEISTTKTRFNLTGRRTKRKITPFHKKRDI